ncbi:copper amine oxidase N-terminal domain-containing protein [Heliorestis convoluta]|uniref:Copper amine oxidase N-terminal domain-containing protein n=1 Tax=Heliorestis convoluta TaxID=356322 RepID=A0A5Q2MZV0_9FIRM|nr:copper amine oxidase N-terminal domain-containing protein [Heliorestis convoluta]QGG47581.1 copper amine oxidase N-terminal domain-containing protein [Heliorestis convoluta]
MRKKTFFTMLLFFFLIPLHAHADEGKGFLVGPSRIEAEQPLTPGNTYHLPPHTVYNNTANKMQVTVSINEQGEGLLAPPKWFEHTPANQEVLSGETGEFASTITVPKDAEPGHYIAWFRFYGEPSQRGAFTHTFALSVPFLFEVLHAEQADSTASYTEQEIILEIGSSTAIVQGKEFTLDAPPYINSATSRTMVPLRYVSEQLQAVVQWVPESQQVIIHTEEVEIVLAKDSERVLINGVEFTLDSPLAIKNGRAFVPLRFVSEVLDATVQWKAEEQRIIIKRVSLRG